MTAPHFFVDDVSGDSIALTPDDARHAARVLRIGEGESVTVSDGRGTVVEATVVDARASGFTVSVTGRRSVERASPRLTVCPALPKAGKLDLVVQKLTELGVDTIAPWPAARSVVRWDTAKARAQTQRWRAIAREAAKQSRRAWLPEVLEPAASAVIDTTIVLHEQEDVRLRDVLEGPVPEAVVLVVGPEGGLTDDEVTSLRARGASVAGLGDQILRFETAALIAPAVVLWHFGRIG